jgi:hypothetical protein
MTLQEAISNIDNLKPNQYTYPQKISWLSELDGKLYNEIIATHEFNEDEETIDWNPYSEQTDPSLELIVGEPYEKIYEYWLAAKIDYWNGETVRYNNDMAMYNTAYQEYANWYNKNHKHKNNLGYRL